MTNAVIKGCGYFDHLGFFNFITSIKPMGLQCFTSIEMWLVWSRLYSATYRSAFEHHSH